MKQNKTEYHVRLLDNGVVVADEVKDFIECEKFSNNGKGDDTAMRNFFGSILWEDISISLDELMCNNLKIEITISKER